MSPRFATFTLLAGLLPNPSSLAGADPASIIQEQSVSLDGAWRIQPAGRDEREIAVPGFWERAPGLAEVHEATYHREFNVPASFAGGRVLLRFEAVGDAAEVSVNGQPVGGHLGPALPFEVDITGVVTVPSTRNQLSVRVRDDSHFRVARRAPEPRNWKYWIPRGVGGNNRKGLYQSVTLRARPPVNVADVRVVTSVRRHELSVTYELFNSHRESVQGRISARVTAREGAVILTLPAKDVELPGFVTTRVTLAAPFEKVELWQPDHPTLYNLQTSLASRPGGAPLHQLSTRFGFRETWFEGIHFFLNGIRCNLRGESPAYSDSDWMATREAALGMIRRYQAANCNALRFHSIPAPPQMLDVCDELGMLLIDESAIYASWQMLMPEHPEFMDHCREHLTRWIRRDRNHPSVILWSAENEGLNVSVLTPAMLAEFRRVIDANDGSRPVIFDGDGTGYGASPASEKHYVKTIEDLKDRGGRASGYGRDLRPDIYWATAYHQDVPLGCGEFLFPYEPGQQEHELEVIYSMGLQARGYRLADWFDIRPYNLSCSGFLGEVRADCREAYDIQVKSFAPVAVFDKDYDGRGPFPKPPRLKAGAALSRTFIVYNDAFSGEEVELNWQAVLEGTPIAAGKRSLHIPLGQHQTLEITFTPPRAGALRLELGSAKGGKEQFHDTRVFTVE